MCKTQAWAPPGFTRVGYWEKSAKETEKEQTERPEENWEASERHPQDASESAESNQLYQIH